MLGGVTFRRFRSDDAWPRERERGAWMRRRRQPRCRLWPKFGRTGRWSGRKRCREAAITARSKRCNRPSTNSNDPQSCGVGGREGGNSLAPFLPTTSDERCVWMQRWQKRLIQVAGEGCRLAGSCSVIALHIGSNSATQQDLSSTRQTCFGDTTASRRLASCCRLCDHPLVVLPAPRHAPLHGHADADDSGPGDEQSKSPSRDGPVSPCKR